MKLRTLVLAAALTVLSVQSAMAGGLVGYNKIDVPAGSDALFTVAFTEAADSSYTVSSVTGSGVTVADALSVDAFADTYYVRFTSGSGEGLWSTIDSNSASEFVLTDTGILSHVSAGDTFAVFPHATLETLFPDELKGISFEATPPPGIFLKTVILVPDTTSVGVNKATAATYYYLNGEWRKFGQPPTSVFNDVVIPPQVYTTLRNGGASPLEFFTLGKVSDLKIARILSTESSTNDIPVGSGFPVPVTLKQLNLGGTPAFQSTPPPGIFVKDQLLVFDNSVPGVNKSASATYFYYNGAWRKFGQPLTQSFDDEVLDPSAAILIRKAGGTPASTVWTQPSPI
ncbi:MAG: TIGR02597 family protein [Candidatus Omnitrophica bacterium]|nr:TIGR02597 family protein [Candidatus Omnitrophota bacterium]